MLIKRYDEFLDGSKKFSVVHIQCAAFISLMLTIPAYLLNLGFVVLVRSSL